MNAKGIRDILIAYLQTQHTEIRIYQEKSIGHSICDVMAVTDCLTGYEIKSDQDNYQRLASQIDAYNKFFDKNYIVIGKSHRNSIVEKIPSHWGIMVIEDSNISIEREAYCIHDLVSIRAQLGILWKLELKNILVKFNLPLYTYKPKDYIIEQIISQVEPQKLSKHIAYELLHRDYSQFQATDYTIYSKTTAMHDSNFPVEEVVDTLSEENLEQITLDHWIALYRQAKNIQVQKEVSFQEEEKSRIPHEIPYTDIEVSPGVPWIRLKIINDFVYFLCNGEDPIRSNYGRVSYEPVTGYWNISYKKDLPLSSDANRINYEYGLPNYNALYIFEATLNLREIKIYTTDRKYNEKDTLAALEKQDKITALFKEWVWRDEDRKWEIEEAYNTMFAKFKPQTYDGSKLTFPEMNEDIRLYPYQMDAVQKILLSKNTLLAFDVGSGKTYIMICAAMKLRQEGIARKNMFVVPNNIVGQWELIFKKLYPSAKILTIEPKTFKPEMRQKVLKQIRDGDYDGIIIAYSCFEMIPLSTKHITKQMNNTLVELKTAIQNTENPHDFRANIKRECDYICNLANRLIPTPTVGDAQISFEQLEINSLFVDEAHNFKNIPLRTKLKNIAGINITGSNKCLEMLEKVRTVQNANKGGGIVFATGTPLCNSISDAYALQMYLQYEDLKELHLDRFDNWVKSFAKPERVCEIDVNVSAFRFVTRFSKFFNLPELSKIFSSIAIFHAVNQNENLPKLNGYSNILIERNLSLEDYMTCLCERTEKIRAKEVKKTEDNMLKVSTDGRKAALDLRLVGKPQAYDSQSKIYQCVQTVHKIYLENDNCAQIIFCDYSTPKKSSFNIYSALRDHLIDLGVPRKEIAFIHSYHSETKRVALFEQVNTGKVRILIGSTFKLGIGANVQSKLKAIHHLDVPWRPADMVQREGRILRMGNTCQSIEIFRYIVEGSFDAYSWQILENKQKFISQFLDGSTYQRTSSDLEENILTYAQVKALAISEPLMKELAQKQNELRRFQLLSSNYAEMQRKKGLSISKLETRITTLEQRYSITVKNAQYLLAYTKEDISKAYQYLKDALSPDIIWGEKKLPIGLNCLGFNIQFPDRQNYKKPFLYLERLGARYEVCMGDSASGNARRLINFIKSFSDLPEKITQEKENLTATLNSYKTSLTNVNPYIEDIQCLQANILQLQSDIKSKNKTENFL